MTTRTKNINRRTTDLLLREGSVPAEVITPLFEQAERDGKWVGELALDKWLVSSDELAGMLARETSLPRIDLSKISPEEGILACVDKDYCLHNLILPLSHQGGVLHVAVANPFDEKAVSALPLPRHTVSISIATVRHLRSTVELWYQTLQPKQECELDTMQAEDTDSLNAQYLHTLEELLNAVVKQHGSDLHLAAGAPPMLRVHGELRPMPLMKLTPAQIRQLILPIISGENLAEFERVHELDISYSLPDYSRFRLNLFKQRGAWGAVFRSIPPDMPRLDNLGMPPILRELCARKNGLILVTGPTGSGKSTTLAAMVEEINRTRAAHIMTIEDPIEYHFQHGKSEINQRQVGRDTDSFANALRHAMRQDADVIFIGEMRDLETIAIAMTAAETGHLVLSTLHTASAIQSVDRIVDVFPTDQQTQIRTQLSSVLEAVITQNLLMVPGGKGRVCVQEILIVTDAVRSLIREGRAHMIHSLIQSGAKLGMQTMEQSLKGLVESRKLSMQDAELLTTDVDEFRALMARTGK